MDHLTERISSVLNLPVKQSISVGTMLNFDGDGQGYNDGDRTYKQALNEEKKRKHCILALTPPPLPGPVCLLTLEHVLLAERILSGSTVRIRRRTILTSHRLSAALTHNPRRPNDSSNR